MRTFFTAALTDHGHSSEVITDRAPALANVIEELLPAALHNTGRYENNRVECDHRRLKARLRPMRGVKTNRTASVVIRGHAFIQNLRRGQYELAVDAAPPFRLATAFNELRPAICSAKAPGPPRQHGLRSSNQQSQSAYVTTYLNNDQHAAALPTWQKIYNTERAHTALEGRPPISCVVPPT